jgi:hypothetical protein
MANYEEKKEEYERRLDAVDAMPASPIRDEAQRLLDVL